MRRRTFLLGLAGAGALGGYLMRPSDRGQGGHSAYYVQLSAALREAGLARPVMLVDLDRLDVNIDLVRKVIQPPFDYRVVAKSVPSHRLLEYVMKRAGTDRLMVFHQPFLNALAVQTPHTDVLIGKPLPITAAHRFYRHYKPGKFNAARQVQWLIDSPARMQQYSDLATAVRQDLRINIEIDVGLHRGGVQRTDDFVEILKMIDTNPRLHFAGLMGYDPHVTKLPSFLQGEEFAAVQRIYRTYMETALRHAGGELPGLCLNAAGSPTFHLWPGGDNPANELAVGTALMKPTDFDIPSLARHVPALFIATPVLKSYDGPVQMPGVPALGRLMSAWDPNARRTFFVYGGYWQAEPVSPPGLQINALYGRSTNQEMLNGSENVDLDVDDYVFYRPTQSEFVMLQFGDLAIVRDGRIIDFWPVLDQVA